MPLRAAATSADDPLNATLSSLNVIDPLVALLIAFSCARSCTSVMTTSTAPRLTSCASSSAACTSAAVPETDVTDVEVTSPVVLPATSVKSAAATAPASSTEIVKSDVYLVASNALAPATSPSYDVSRLSTPPPPQAAKGNSRSGTRPFFCFFAAVAHLRRKASRASPAGMSTNSKSSPLRRAAARTSEPSATT